MFLRLEKPKGKILPISKDFDKRKHVALVWTEIFCCLKRRKNVKNRILELSLLRCYKFSKLLSALEVEMAILTRGNPSAWACCWSSPVKCKFSSASGWVCGRGSSSSSDLIEQWRPSCSSGSPHCCCPSWLRSTLTWVWHQSFWRACEAVKTNSVYSLFNRTMQLNSWESLTVWKGPLPLLQVATSRRLRQLKYRN